MTLAWDAHALVHQPLSIFDANVVHTDWYAPGEWAAVEPRFEQYRAWLTLQHVDGARRVYALNSKGADR